MGIEQNNFIELIKSIILNQEAKVTNLDLLMTFKYAKFHSLEYIIYLGLKKLNINEESELFQKFKKSATINAYKSVIQDIELDSVSKAFEENKIKHMPLKGAILRKLYPDIQWRSMADLDILISENEMSKGGNILKKLGYSADHLGGNHDCYVKKPYMNIELHRGMIADIYDISKYYENIWEKNTKVHDKEYLYQLSDDDFFIFMIAHAAKHFSGGGTGFRTIIDIYYYINQKELNYNYIYQELKKMELDKFCKLFISISNYIFKDEVSEYTIEDLELVINYVINCGTYGTVTNSSITSIELTNENVDSNNLEKGKKKLVLRRLFPSYKMMKRRNPSLEKFPFLLPWFWFTRLLKGLFNSKTHKKTYNSIKNVDVEKYNEVKKIKDLSGVKL